MSGYSNNNDSGGLILIVNQHGQNFGIPLGAVGSHAVIGTVTLIEGMTCTVKTVSGVSLTCDVFYDEPRIGDRAAVFSDGERNYAMLGLRNRTVSE